MILGCVVWVRIFVGYKILQILQILIHPQKREKKRETKKKTEIERKRKRQN